jgi:WD40 repeat protein
MTNSTPASASASSTKQVAAGNNADVGARVFGRRTFLAGAALAGVAGCFEHNLPRRSVRGVRLGQHAGPVRCVVFVDEQYAWSADAGPSATICLWDLAARRLVRTIPAPGSIQELDLVCGDPQRLVVTSVSRRQDGWVYLVSVLDAATGRGLRRIVEGQWGAISVCGMAALPGERLLLSHFDRAQPDSSELWSLDSSRLIRRFPLAAERVTPDRSNGLEGCRIWDLDTGRVKLERPTERVTWGVAIAPDGSRAVSQGGGAFLWNACGIIKTLSDQRGWLWSGAFTADGALLLTGSDSRFIVRDGRSGVSIATLEGHHRTVLGAATAPRGRLALSGDRSGTVVLWRLPAAA